MASQCVTRNLAITAYTSRLPAQCHRGQAAPRVPAICWNPAHWLLSCCAQTALRGPQDPLSPSPAGFFQALFSSASLVFKMASALPLLCISLSFLGFHDTKGSKESFCHGPDLFGQCCFLEHSDGKNSEPSLLHFLHLENSLSSFKDQLKFHLLGIVVGVGHMPPCSQFSVQILL